MRLSPTGDVNLIFGGGGGGGGAISLNGNRLRVA